MTRMVAGIPRCKHGAPTWACNEENVDEARAALRRAFRKLNPHGTYENLLEALIAAVRAERINVTDCHEAGRMAGRAEAAQELAALREVIATMPNPYDEGDEHTTEAMLAIGFEKGRAAAFAATPAEDGEGLT